HACALPVLVRVPYPRAAAVQQALDLGAAGVMVPHVDDARIAAEVVRAARYGQGGARGFSNSSRAGGYGARGMAEHLRASDAHTTVIVQIESAQAVAEASAIAAVPGVDCLFVGPADLAVSLGAQGLDDPRVADA
ncbi:aldolase/citrate lyase family protein, partial [Raoultella terrigena]